MREKGRKKVNKGFILITSLVVTVLLVMFSAVAMSMTVFQQRTTLLFTQHVAATKAAEAGINYAMARLNLFHNWQGCLPAEGSGGLPQGFNLTQTSYPNHPGVVVHEHVVSGADGCVEGKLTMGTHNNPVVGYFDMYFAKPSTCSDMVFFGTDKEAGDLPDIITLSVNHSKASSSANESPVYVKNSEDQVVPNYQIPGDSILLVCRGRSGTVTKTIEACVRYSPSDVTTTLAAGKNINFNHTGKSENEKIVLDKGEGGPSILRSTGKLIFSLDPHSIDFYAPNNFDYLEIRDNKGGGKVSGPSNNPGSEYAFNPEPAIGLSNFSAGEDQSGFLQPIKINDIKPDTSSFPITLKAGIYILDTHAEGGTPTISYLNYQSEEDYKAAQQVFLADLKTKPKYVPLFVPPDPPLDYETEWKPLYNEFIEEYKAWGEAQFTNVTSDFASLGSSKISWDESTRTMTFNASCKVVQATDNTGKIMKDITFTRNENYGLRIQVGDSSESAGNNEPIYFVNDCAENSAINIDGQFFGYGTIICTGDLEMRAQSQLDPRTSANITIYSGGTVTIKELSEKNNEDQYLIPFVSDLDQDEAMVAEAVLYNRKNSIYEKIYQVYRIVEDSGGSTDKIEGTVEKSAFTSEEQVIIESIYGSDCWGININTGMPAFCFTLRKDKYTKNNPYPDPSGDDEPDPNGNRYFPVFPKQEGPEPEPGLLEYFHVENKDEFQKDELGQRIKDDKGREIDVNDSIFRGFIYVCGDFIVRNGGFSFVLDGGLLAPGRDIYGQDGPGGDISIEASDCYLRFNTSRMSFLTQLGNNYFQPLFWSLR